MKLIRTELIIPVNYDLAIHEGKYYFHYFLPNEDDGIGAGSVGPFDSEFIAAKEANSHFKEYGRF